MRRVVDSNFFRAPALREYLAASPTNQAVIADHASMETPGVKLAVASRSPSL